MVLIEPVEVKGRGKFPHIVRGLVSGSNNIPLTTITHGPREVVKILAWDTTNDAIYYLSTLRTDPGQRHLMRTGLGSDHDLGAPECLTCPESRQNTSSCASNISCEYNEIRVSPE